MSARRARPCRSARRTSSAKRKRAANLRARARHYRTSARRRSISCADAMASPTRTIACERRTASPDRRAGPARSSNGRGAAVRAFVATTGLLIASSCGTQSIDLTRSTVTGDASVTELHCSAPSDCPSGTYCEKPSCADETGTCTFFPPECPDDDAPVCGCDRITYFNDCLRKAAGVASAKPGPCGLPDGTSCGGKMDVQCPEGSLCARFVGPGPCPMDAMGSCWVVPASCPTKTMKPEWDSCFSFYKCLDTCTAIKTGGPYRRAFNCN